MMSSGGVSFFESYLVEEMAEKGASHVKSTIEFSIAFDLEASSRRQLTFLHRNESGPCLNDIGSHTTVFASIV